MLCLRFNGIQARSSVWPKHLAPLHCAWFHDHARNRGLEDTWEHSPFLHPNDHGPAFEALGASDMVSVCQRHLQRIRTICGCMTADLGWILSEPSTVSQESKPAVSIQ